MRYELTFAGNVLSFVIRYKKMEPFELAFDHVNFPVADDNLS